MKTKMFRGFILTAAVSAALLAASCSKDGKDEAEQPVPQPDEELVGEYSIRVERLDTSGLALNSKAVAYLDRFVKENSITVKSTNEATDTAAKAAQLLELAKAEFATIKGKFNQEEFEALAKADLPLGDEPVEMKAENINVSGEISADITLFAKDGTKVGETFHVSANPSDKRNNFVLTVDFGGQTLDVAKVNDSSSVFTNRISTFKTANTLAEANVKMVWKNLTVINSDPVSSDRNAFIEYLLSSKDILTFTDVKSGFALGRSGGIIPDYETVQVLFDNGLRTTTWDITDNSGTIEKKVSIKDILDNKAKDPKFLVRFTNTNGNLKLDFTGISVVDTALIGTLSRLWSGDALQVSTSSPVVEMSGAWVIAGNNSTITLISKFCYFKDSNYELVEPWPTRKFIDTNGDWKYPLIETAKQNSTEPSANAKLIYNFFSGRTWPNVP